MNILKNSLDKFVFFPSVLCFILITDPDLDQDPALLRGRLSKWWSII